MPFSKYRRRIKFSRRRNRGLEVTTTQFRELENKWANVSDFANWKKKAATNARK